MVNILWNSYTILKLMFPLFPTPIFCIIYLRIDYQKELCQRVWTFDTQCQIILHKSCCQINNNVHFTVLTNPICWWWLLLLVLFFRGGCLICVFNEYLIGVWKKVYSLFIRYKNIYGTCIWLVQVVTNIFCSLGDAWKAHSIVPVA